jgi:hypothetical protein
VTVTLQGIGEGAKRNLNPPAKPRPQSDAAGAFACFVDLSAEASCSADFKTGPRTAADLYRLAGSS